jgi:hypothetical protein
MSSVPSVRRAWIVTVKAVPAATDDVEGVTTKAEGSGVAVVAVVTKGVLCHSWASARMAYVYVVVGESPVSVHVVLTTATHTVTAVGAVR